MEIFIIFLKNFARFVYPALIFLSIIFYSLHFITWEEGKKSGLLLKIISIILGVACGFLLSTILVHFI